MNISTQSVHIPAHLRQYITEQKYDHYTAIDHETWRRVMKRNHDFLPNVAHPAYVDGLVKTGVTLDRIPRVEEMSECLRPFGWSAVTIDGFIPGVAFFDFQARGILPIAADIRRPEHLEYTPAPDIIHEAAGHAPILSDELYARYVKRFGQIGSKALATKEEHDVFTATKHFSNVMEQRTASKEEIRAAREELEARQAAVRGLSEAEQISRLYWWTVEYGLIGTVQKPLIYGAGLLSSVGESRHCLTDAVKKIPFELEEVMATGYDITTHQPQLFVCEAFEQLIEAVESYSERMAFIVGGTKSLEKAIRSGHTATAQYSSGLQVSGTFIALEYNGQGEAVYMTTTGPSALACKGQEIPGHGTETHAHGFSAPIGRLAGDTRPLETYSREDLHAAGIRAEERACLLFESGIEVSGIPVDFVYEDGSLLLISFWDCTVRRGEKVLFRPEWGTYDMAVGERIVSVFAEAADNEAFYSGTTL